MIEANVSRKSQQRCTKEWQLARSKAFLHNTVYVAVADCMPTMKCAYAIGSAEPNQQFPAFIATCAESSVELTLVESAISIHARHYGCTGEYEKLAQRANKRIQH